MATFSARQRGFTYLSLLFFIAVLGVGLAATAVSWQTTRQREKERELLAIGSEFRDAIALFYQRSPGMVKEYPRNLTDLVRDARYPMVQRYLRRIYRDPMTGNAEWGIVTGPGGGIIGVYSLSNESPLQKRGFRETDQGFSNAVSYSDWHFIYLPPPVAASGAGNFPFPTSNTKSLQYDAAH